MFLQGFATLGIILGSCEELEASFFSIDFPCLIDTGGSYRKPIH